jgi:ribosome maturation factor RimP
MRALSEIEYRILDMIEPVAKAQGLDVVRVRVTGSQAPVLQIMAERPDGTMSVAACAKFSRALNPILDEQDPIAGEYSLEVSSPGIDRPLTRVGDFAKWIGHEIRVELTYANAEGRKRFHGWIENEIDGVVALRLKDGGDASIPVSDMSRAALVLTDKLIQEARAKGLAAADVDVDEDGDEELEGEDGEFVAEDGEAGDEDDFDDVEVDDEEEFEDDELDDEDDLDDSDAEDQDERK